MTSLSAKRILVLVGAGASVDFGIPQTTGFTKQLEAHLQADAYCVRSGGWDAYQFVKAELVKYYRSKDEAHFERIYHALHELAAMKVLAGAVPKYKPVMLPFMQPNHGLEIDALKAAASSMLEAIYSIASASSAAPKQSLAPLSEFVRRLESIATTRIYTTNYDDFFSQASPHLFTGFTKKRGEFSLFSPEDYWSCWEQSGLFHLHGSVHLGFPSWLSGDPSIDIGELGWFESGDEAFKHSTFSGSGRPRPDGTELERSAIVTGLDKLGRLQQTPYLYYYSGLARDIVEADLIFVLGSGLGDYHLNTYMRQARKSEEPTPLIYVSYWDKGWKGLFKALECIETDQSEAMTQELRLGRISNLKFNAYPGWTTNSDAKAAIYTNGFYSFLKDPDSLDRVLQDIGA
ncbi:MULTISPECIES: SIR2 family protein [Pseudomonas]|uniref:SIR2 family protein n=1 Tax=Pseudomonas TaxID=286 RepID=UPI0005C621BD|nr:MULTISPECIES: SIR2 family protein [Pseudomonas]WOB57032.1 SIR2 family protein [Pseudomonas sp. NBB]